MGKSKILIKIFIFLMLIFTSLLLSSCLFITEYSITYYVDGEAVELEPSKYKAGVEIELPTVDAPFFSGWYTNKDLNGKVYTVIDKDKRGELSFYAITNNDVASLSELIENSTKYKCDVTITSGDSEKKCSYYYNSGIYKLGNSSYFYDNNSKDYVYTVKTNANTYGIPKESSVFEYVLADNVFFMIDQVKEEYISPVANGYRIDVNNTNNYCEKVLSFNHCLSCNYILISYKNKRVDTVEVVCENNYKITFTYTYNSYQSIFEKPTFILVSDEDLELKTFTKYHLLIGDSESTLLNKLDFKIVYLNDVIYVVSKDDIALSGEFDTNVGKEYTLNARFLDFTCAFTVVVSEEIKLTRASEDCEILYDVIKKANVVNGEAQGICCGYKSEGGKCLVIPIEFSDYKAPTSVCNTLNKAFFGTSEDTGWESVASYYEKTSYGKAKISGVVLPAFNTEKNHNYYSRQSDYTVAVNSIIKAALEFYDDDINYSDYDSDGDGYIDALYIVYVCPVDYEDDSLYWAFTDEYLTEGPEYYDGVEADFYTFLGLDFLYEELANGRKITLNCETFIHESGHIFGFDDYYDFDGRKGPLGGYGGGDMMDYNIGDNNPYTKSIAGWINPYILDLSEQSADVTLSLDAFGKSGDALIVTGDWNNTFFDEYYIIDYYTPDGLNALEKGHNGLFSVGGLRITYVNAHVGTIETAYSIYEITKYNNGETKKKLIELVEADGRKDILNDNYSSNSDLFKANDTFSEFVWEDGETSTVTLKVESIGDVCILSFSFE